MSDTAWQMAEEKADKADGGGAYLRFKDDGDSAVVAFLGDPTPREVVWTGDGYAPCDSDEAKSAISLGKKPSLRVAIDCYVFGEQAIKTWDMNAPTFKGLVKVRAKYGLDGRAFEIERQGAKGDPQTKYTILPDRELTAAERAHIARLGTGAANDNDVAPPAVSDGELIDLATAREIADRLRALPDAQKAADELLTHFRVGKLRELRASHRRAALAFVDELEIATRDSDDLPF